MLASVAGYSALRHIRMPITPTMLVAEMNIKTTPSLEKAARSTAYLCARLFQEHAVDCGACEVRDILDGALHIHNLNILQLFALCLVWLLERSELTVHHSILHVVTLPGAHASEEGGLVGAEVDEVDVRVRVFVVESGGADDVSVLLLQCAASDDHTLGSVLEGYQRLVSQEDQPVPSVLVVQGYSSGHLIDVRLRMELNKLADCKVE